MVFIYYVGYDAQIRLPEYGNKILARSLPLPPSLALSLSTPFLFLFTYICFPVFIYPCVHLSPAVP